MHTLTPSKSGSILSLAYRQGHTEHEHPVEAAGVSVIDGSGRERHRSLLVIEIDAPPLRG